MRNNLVTGYIEAVALFPPVERRRRAMISIAVLSVWTCDKCRFLRIEPVWAVTFQRAYPGGIKRSDPRGYPPLRSYPPHPSLLVRVTFARDDQRRHSSQARICGIASQTQAMRDDLAMKLAGRCLRGSLSSVSRRCRTTGIAWIRVSAILIAHKAPVITRITSGKDLSIYAYTDVGNAQVTSINNCGFKQVYATFATLNF